MKNLNVDTDAGHGNEPPVKQQEKSPVEKPTE